MCTYWPSVQCLVDNGPFLPAEYSFQQEGWLERLLSGFPQHALDPGEFRVYYASPPGIYHVIGICHPVIVLVLLTRALIGPVFERPLKFFHDGRYNDSWNCWTKNGGGVWLRCEHNCSWLYITVSRTLLDRKKNNFNEQCCWIFLPNFADLCSSHLYSPVTLTPLSRCMVPPNHRHMQHLCDCDAQCLSVIIN